MYLASEKARVDNLIFWDSAGGIVPIASTVPVELRGVYLVYSRGFSRWYTRLRIQ